MLSGIKINLDFISWTYYNRILQETFTFYSLDAINGREYRKPRMIRRKTTTIRSRVSFMKKFIWLGSWKSKKK